jgi:hypothetical protein
MREVDARRALAGRALSFLLLAPVGAYAGRGAIRVLRIALRQAQGDSDERLQLVCGYESYERIA